MMQDSRIVWAMVINTSLIVWGLVGSGVYLVVTGRLDIVSASTVVGPLIGALLTFLGAGGGFAAYHVSSKARPPTP